MAKKSLTDKNGEVRELTSNDFKNFRPARGVLPPEFFADMDKLKAKRMRGRPKKPVTKTRLTLRLDADIVAWLKQSGRGYQTKINNILRGAIKD